MPNPECIPGILLFSPRPTGVDFKVKPTLKEQFEKFSPLKWLSIRKILRVLAFEKELPTLMKLCAQPLGKAGERIALLIELAEKPVVHYSSATLAGG
ncbi:hypothetical protein [Thermococcus sp.]